jgi:hypothetical protein
VLLSPLIIAGNVPHTCHLPAAAGCGDEASLPERDFTYYPRITAMSTMYPDEPDAAQATYSLVINRPQSFSFIEDIGKSVAK